MKSECQLWRNRQRHYLALLGAVLPIFFALWCGATAAAPLADNGNGAHWMSVWGTALQSVSDNPAAPSYDRAPVLSAQTVRQIVYPRVGGHVVRLRLSNQGGRQPVTIDAVRVARAARGAATLPQTDRAVHFSGAAAVTLAPGAWRDSDPIDIELSAGAPLAVSFFISKRVAPSTWHKLASQVTYLSTPGDHSADASADAFKGRSTAYFWLQNVAVQVPGARPSVVVAIGDSITDGMRSSLNANRRWPDALAQRLAPAMPDISVINAGISGNRLLSDSACYGDALRSRFGRDALAVPGIRYAIVLIGINDINFAEMPPHAGLDCDAPHAAVDAASMIAGYQALANAAHHQGVKIYGATLTPASLPPRSEALRQQLNRWIRTARVFDAVVDFDAALRDSADPAMLARQFDSGDHIHPNDAGYTKMAAAVPLSLFESH